MRRDLEALLFATDQPLSIDKLASFFTEVDRAAVRQAIEDLRAEYDRDEHAFTVVEFGGGYSITTRPEHAKIVRRLFRGRRKQRLSRAALEVLAIIAYKQPVTRLEIEEIRGVSASGVLGTLLERDLVHIVGRAESLGHPLLYGTTKTFLDYIGLRDLRELPQLTELEDLLAEREQLKQLASDRGEEIDDESLERALSPEDPADEAEEGETPSPENAPDAFDTDEVPASDDGDERQRLPRDDSGSDGPSAESDEGTADEEERHAEA